MQLCLGIFASMLCPVQGKVILVVNVASQCGFTPQYKELAELDSRYRSKGLVILGFPCNQVRQLCMERISEWPCCTSHNAYPQSCNFFHKDI